MIYISFIKQAHENVLDEPSCYLLHSALIIIHNHFIYAASLEAAPNSFSLPNKPLAWPQSVKNPYHHQ